jgi:hypothetical protein
VAFKPPRTATNTLQAAAAAAAAAAGRFIQEGLPLLLGCVLTCCSLHMCCSGCCCCWGVCGWAGGGSWLSGHRGDPSLSSSSQLLSCLACAISCALCQTVAWQPVRCMSAFMLAMPTPGRIRHTDTHIVPAPTPCICCLHRLCSTTAGEL